MKNIIDKLKPYFMTSGIVLSILIVVFLFKGIYPFGNNSLIWGDMHDQITAFYYHFYDSIMGDSSLLINFSTSGGINFLGIMAYYILSPLSFITLLVEREKIYLVVSIIIAFKILLCSLTCLYSIRTLFKKIPSLLSVLLAIIYAFSGYAIIMYQITPWIDAMYMFPLIIIGLKKTLDLEKPTMYIVTLTLSLIFSFYVTVMVIIFIFLASLIYLLVYKEDKVLIKKGILALGISTIISLLLSLFIVIPSFLQISVSSRMGSSINTLLNSKTGPITDKLSMFLFGGIIYVGLLLLLKNYKKHIKFLSFYIPVLLLVLIPLLIEPINKIWHFGSYAFFPYRFGFISMFLLVFGAAYMFNNYKTIRGVYLKRNKLFSIILTLVITVSTFIIIYVNYSNFQASINTLTISRNHLLLLVLALSTLSSTIGCLIILFLNKELNKFALILISIITFTHITVNTSIYLGMDYEQDKLMSQYEELTSISKDYKDGNYYRVKNEATNMIMNSGMVMKYHTWDHFTSLTDGNNIKSLKKLGYSSMWVKTFSRGGNLFLDSILANKYIITRNKIDNDYYKLVNKYDNLYFYELINNPSYGYLLDRNDSIFDKNNSFEISNSIYKNITGNKENIFEIINDFENKNIKTTNCNDNVYYEIIDKDAFNYIETDIKVENSKTLYLEILRSIINNDNYEMYEKFNIYINDKLYKQSAFNENDNGVLYLGTYSDETVNVKIQFIDSVDLNNITVGVMDNSLYEEFLEQEYIETNVVYKENNILAKVDSKEEKILFLPIVYNDNYTAYNNGKEVEIIKVYDNFIGINLEKGVNEIEISFIPKGLKICLIISFITLLVSVILLSKNIYSKLLENKVLYNLAYYVYMFIYLAIVLLVYIGLTLCFIISYFYNFNI